MTTLDESKFKDLKTTRGFNYHYFAQSPASNSSLPTILFLHGYPNFSGDWHYQVAHFTKLGYGAIVPDLLGYGGTDKPTDPRSYGLKGMSNDVKEILDAEGVDKAVVIGHDWYVVTIILKSCLQADVQLLRGSIVTSRFVVYYPDRVIALGLLALGWTASLAGLDYQKSMAMLRAATGNDVIGYWEFMSADDADELLLQHVGVLD
jgi:pimeloyl-ACP methyl ester carboxylesterase